jgi:acetyltransferase-like isoleucine patch superfamily enzyme
MNEEAFKAAFLALIHNRDNPYHPLVWILGKPEIGADTVIGAFSEVNATGARLTIGHDCDIASFVAINCADSHLKAIGLSDKVARQDVRIGHHVFVGSHSVILGGADIGHHSVIAAGTVVRASRVPPFSLVHGNPMVIRAGYYRERFIAALGHLPDE